MKEYLDQNIIIKQEDYDRIEKEKKGFRTNCGYVTGMTKEQFRIQTESICLKNGLGFNIFL